MKNTINKLFLSGMLISSVGLILLPLMTALIGTIIGTVLLTKDEILKGIIVIITALGFCGVSVYLSLLLQIYQISISTVWVIIVIFFIATAFTVWANWEHNDNEIEIN